MEKGKPISSQADALLEGLKETQPSLYNSIEKRVEIRTEMNALSQKMESLSQEYAQILQDHREYF